MAVDRFRAVERYVSVRGLAELEVPADVAVWPVTYSAGGTTPAEVQARLEEAEGVIRAFLTRAGFAPEDIGKSPPRLTDLHAHHYGDRPPPERFRAESTLTLRSQEPDKVRAAAQRADELVAAGVVLATHWGDPVQYLFTGLNDIKPAMIAAATRDAQAAADKFAEDSGGKVGGIRRGSQGYFSIEDRDAWTPEIKRVRVVTSVDYFLSDG
ncbi:MAG: SIMPL domain-containing protein [Gammaproteobacteria bacterium]|nr:SIMPL domain-containing protein [Gammaproteobacteria bacterium]